jgi:hypothetical protein
MDNQFDIRIFIIVRDGHAPIVWVGSGYIVGSNFRGGDQNSSYLCDNFLDFFGIQNFIFKIFSKF